MTTILDTEFPRTLDTLLARYGTEACRDMRLEAWLFEPAAARRAAEAQLAGFGVQARLHSAYKPLLHALQEDVGLANLRALRIAVPSHPAGSLLRFRLEAYPLAALLPGIAVEFTQGAAELDYEVTLTHEDGSEETRRILAPNRLRTDHLGEQTLANCGWLRAWHPGTATPFKDGPLPTEFEQVFEAAMTAIAGHDWGNTVPLFPAPLFPALEIRIATGGIETPLAWQDEVLSTREALHEELYFSTLEYFHQRSGHPRGYRGLQPGQIIPDIQPSEGPTTLRITAGASAAFTPPPDAAEPLDTATTPIGAERIAAELAALKGERIDATSVQGRLVPAAWFPAPGPGILLSGGQHANETSAVIGTLRAAPQLLKRGAINLALIPQENPDGYALHQRLRATHPRHMHHAARYTALGDDLQTRAAPPWHEAESRHTAFRRAGVQFHINLHGYPAHEWTRPLNGYVPTGFELWTVPKGFFLILNHAPGLGPAADRLARALAARLATDPELAAFNATHLDAYLAHAGSLAAPVHSGIPCLITEQPSPIVPLTLISEYPDETIYGDAFRLAHTTQMRTALEAVDLFLADKDLHAHA